MFEVASLLLSRFSKAATMKGAVFSGLTPCISQKGWRFGGTYRLNLQGKNKVQLFFFVWLFFGPHDGGYSSKTLGDITQKTLPFLLDSTFKKDGSQNRRTWPHVEKVLIPFRRQVAYWTYDVPALTLSTQVDVCNWNTSLLFFRLSWWFSSRACASRGPPKGPISSSSPTRARGTKRPVWGLDQLQPKLWPWGRRQLRWPGLRPRCECCWWQRLHVPVSR
jgi:hypothetical protein